MANCLAAAHPSKGMPTPGTPSRRSFDDLRTWSRAPRLTWWFMLAVAVALFLRKPHALHTPQLYAEDGSIFLTFNDLHGWRAIFEPYMGYLLVVPRLIAWLASHLLDPAWWPAFYNGTAFTIWLAVIARLFSPRLDLPAKPGLALAVFIGPQTGEVLFNITNIQWVTALLLVQQVLIARPSNHAQLFGDLVIIALVGLTGPFAIAFAPLFAWRWWRERNFANSAVLAIATICAGVQAWLVLSTGPKFQFPPFLPGPFVEKLGQRLLGWPLLGDRLVLSLPAQAIGIAGLVMVAALLAWALRRHARRNLRAPIVGAFLLMMIAMIYRSRPDTWPRADLDFGDRYFYIPRVMLLWLIAWEFDSRPRAIPWIAGGVFAVWALVPLKGYMLPAPPNYHWAQHVDSIRRGVPANIPTLPEGWTLEYRGRPERK